VKAKEVVQGIAQDERGVQYEIELAAKFAQVRKLNWKAAAQAVLAAKKFDQAVFLRTHQSMCVCMSECECASVCVEGRF
jgi:hypothetical protein